MASQEIPVVSAFPAQPPRFDDAAVRYVTEALESQNLFHTRPGGFCQRLCEAMCRATGASHAAACSSGTAAVHVALGALRIEPGAEVITSPITDMGTLIGILFQNAIPVFADVDPHTYNLTADTISEAITPRTRAVVVVHLAGGACDMSAIATLCKSKGIKLIEDCAQAWGATYRNKHVGTFGDAGCFSFNHFKHLSCGDGGVVTTQDAAVAERCRNFSDKYYDRAGRGVRMHELGINYRMTELQAAVAVSQLEKLQSIVTRRNSLGDGLTSRIAAAGLPGVTPHGVVEGSLCSYWFYMLRIDPGQAGVTRDDVNARFASVGIPCRGGYLPRPIYREAVFQNKQFFPGGVWPAEAVAGRSYDYRTTQTPVAEAVLRSALVLPIHEGLELPDMDQYVQILADVIRR